MLNNINILLSKVGAVRSEIKPLSLSDIPTVYFEFSCGLEILYNVLNNYLKNNSMDAIKKASGLLFRATKKNNSLIQILKPGIRLSQDTNNLYNMLISEILPSWAGWPRRNRSTICHTSYTEAEFYYNRSKTSSSIFFVIPENNAKLVVCQHTDIWMSFKKISVTRFTKNLAVFLSIFLFIMNDKNMFKTLINGESEFINQFINDKEWQEISADESSYELKNLFVYIETFIKKLNKKDYNSLCDKIIYIFSNIKYISEDIAFNLNVLGLLNKLRNGEKFIEIFDEIMDPEYNKFDMEYYDKFVLNIDNYNDREVWTESTCLMINFFDYLKDNSKEIKALTDVIYEEI